MLSDALSEAEQRRIAQMTVDDELLGLNEEELDRFILNEEEVRLKERVWVELNKEYLEAIAGEQIIYPSFSCTWMDVLLNSCFEAKEIRNRLRQPRAGRFVSRTRHF
jgi:hypothetical protein